MTGKINIELLFEDCGIDQDLDAKEIQKDIERALIETARKVDWAGFYHMHLNSDGVIVEKTVKLNSGPYASAYVRANNCAPLGHTNFVRLEAYELIMSKKDDEL